MSDPVLVAKMFLAERSQTFQLSDGKSVGEVLKFSAVYGKDNEQWAKWTPSGQLTLHVNNPDALERVTGGHYKILIVPCGVDE